MLQGCRRPILPLAASIIWLLLRWILRKPQICLNIAYLSEVFGRCCWPSQDIDGFPQQQDEVVGHRWPPGLGQQAAIQALPTQQGYGSLPSPRVIDCIWVRKAKWGHSSLLPWYYLARDTNLH